MGEMDLVEESQVELADLALEEGHAEQADSRRVETSKEEIVKPRRLRK